MYIQTHENENTTCQNMWDTAKAGLKGKLEALKVCPRKDKRSRINHLASYLMKIQKE